MGRTVQTARPQNDAPRRQKAKGPSTIKVSSYWQGNGKHQEKYLKLTEKLEQLAHPLDWTAPENEHWALLNGMTGIHYGYYNDGDTPEASIENNRVHGPMGKSLEAFYDFCADLLGKKSPILKYLKENEINGPLLEEAMDEAVLYVWEEMS